MAEAEPGYRDPTRLTAWVRYMLYAQIAIAVISMVSGYLEYQVLTDYKNGVYTSQELAVADGVASDRRQRTVAIAFLVVFVVSGFLILRWIHRANHNARHLGAKRMEFSPGWSIGYYFIPFLNLWRPYQAMKEIWRVSADPSDWASRRSGGLLPLWWALWLLSNLAGQVLFRASLRAQELQELINLNMISQISDASGIPLAIVFLVIVNRVHDLQVAKHAKTPGASAMPERALTV